MHCVLRCGLGEGLTWQGKLVEVFGGDGAGRKLRFVLRTMDGGDPYKYWGVLNQKGYEASFCRFVESD